jgi:nucleotide-binding universal stress UspA family protein
MIMMIEIILCNDFKQNFLAGQNDLSTINAKAMKTILVPLDLQSSSIRALRYIDDVFREQPIKLIFLNVIGIEDPRNNQDVEQAFRQFETRVLDGYSLEYDFKMVRGLLLVEIQKAIHQYNPSLVIMATTGKNLTKALLKLVDCPILIIPEHNTKNSIKNIAYANDFNVVKSSAALAPLLDLSQTFDAKVHIIHLNKDNRGEPDAAEDSLEYTLQEIEHEYASIISKDYVKDLQEYVATENIDVLSVLLRDHGQNQINAGGKLVEELVNNADVPVLSLV